MEYQDSLIEKMRRVVYFRPLSTEELRAILDVGDLRRIDLGTVILGEGEPCAGLFVLLDGQIELCKHSRAGQMCIVSIVNPVTMFNEVASLDNGPNPVTAIAAADSLVWWLSATALQQLILRHPQLALGLLQVLARRNRLLIAQFEDLAFRPVVARIAKLLLALSGQGRYPIDRRQHTNTRMSALVSTVPEAFSRGLRLLRENGAVICTPRQIIINRPEDLFDTSGLAPEAPCDGPQPST